MMRLAWMTICFLIQTTICFALSKEDAIQLRGSATTSGDVYWSSSPDTAWRPRLPPIMGRAVLRASVLLFNQIEIPFELYLGSRQFASLQPFNQFGASPKITNWLTVHGGYFSTRVSDFTFGDLRLLGGGVDATPGNFRFSAYYGAGRQANESQDNIIGNMRRMVWMGKIGYDNGAGTSAIISLFHAADDVNSVRQDSLMPPPTENIAASVSFSLAPANNVSIIGEIAAAGLSNDIRSKRIDSVYKVPLNLFAVRTSTQFDGAAKLAVRYSYASFGSVGIEAQWVGPGYTTHGYMQLPNDIFDISLSPTLRLFQNTLFLRSSLGVRTNNLRGNRLSATQRLIGSLHSSWQPEHYFGIDASYSNFGIRSQHENDTLRLQNIFQQLSISPRYSFSAANIEHMLLTQISVQDFDDKNSITGRFGKSNTVSALISHTLTMSKGSAFSTAIAYTKTDNPLSSLSLWNISETYADSYFDSRLTVSAAPGLGFIQNNGTDVQFTGRISGAYSLESMGNLILTVNMNSYDVNSVNFSPSFREYQATLQYNIRF